MYIRIDCKNVFNQGNRDMRKMLELQLHEQYAVNNNANLGSMVTLIVGVIAVLGAFGYVYLYSSQMFAANFGALIGRDGLYTVDALVLTAIASIFVLAVIFMLCLDRGAYQRKEQFIIYAIRYQYFQELKDPSQSTKMPCAIFPKNYTPYNKNMCNFVQGFFGFMMYVCAIISAAIVILTFLKVVSCISVVVFAIVAFILTVIYCWNRWRLKYRDYKNLENEYMILKNR